MKAINPDISFPITSGVKIVAKITNINNSYRIIIPMAPNPIKIFEIRFINGS